MRGPHDHSNAIALMEIPIGGRCGGGTSCTCVGTDHHQVGRTRCEHHNYHGGADIHGRSGGRGEEDACDAVDRTNDPLTRAAKNAWAAPPATPESALAVTEFQKVALVEVGYLESRTRPETPEPVRGAVRAYTTAIYAAVDAVTRGTPAADRVNDVKEAGAQIDKACG